MEDKTFIETGISMI